MSNFIHKGKLAYGFIDKNGHTHYDFELKLLTVKGEINSINTLLSDYPDLSKKNPQEQFVMDRAANLSEMMTIDGNKLTIDEILGLAADEFTILMEAETELRKKRSEPTQLAKQDQEK